MNPISIRLSDNVNQMLTMKSFSVSELVSGSDDTPVLISVVNVKEISIVYSDVSSKGLG
jgi:hypothetical protein